MLQYLYDETIVFSNVRVDEEDTEFLLEEVR